MKAAEVKIFRLVGSNISNGAIQCFHVSVFMCLGFLLWADIIRAS